MWRTTAQNGSGLDVGPVEGVLPQLSWLWQQALLPRKLPVEALAAFVTARFRASSTHAPGLWPGRTLTYISARSLWSPPCRAAGHWRLCQRAADGGAAAAQPRAAGGAGGGTPAAARTGDRAQAPAGEGLVDFGKSVRYACICLPAALIKYLDLAAMRTCVCACGRGFNWVQSCCTAKGVVGAGAERSTPWVHSCLAWEGDGAPLLQLMPGGGQL